MNSAVRRIVLPLLLVAAVLVFFMPRTAKFGYDYKKGKEWEHETLYAQFDFPIFKTEEEMIEELGNASSTVIPYYRFSEDVVNSSMRQAEGLNLGPHKSAIINEMRELYSRGIIGDDGVKQASRSQTSDVYYVQKDKRAAKYPVADACRVSDARARLLASLNERYRSYNFDSLFRRQGVYDLIVPNLLYDRQTTELVNAETKSQVSPTSGYVAAGQLIVSSGEMVTSEIEQMLDSYKKEYEANLGYSGPKILFWLGNIIIALMIVILLALVIYFTNPNVFNDNRFYYILLIFLMAAVIPLLIARFREDMLYMVPFTLFALLLQAFFKPRLIIPIYLVSLMPTLILTHNGLILFTIFSVAGVIAVEAFRHVTHIWWQFVVAGITFMVLAITYSALHFLDLATANMIRIFIYLFIASGLAVAGYPLVYLFEKLFNLVSNSRLAELCDSSSSLLRELEQKAPGTFQHSRAVMNMADTASRAIGANQLLVRAGALYHDIGKMSSPQSFVENESLLGADWIGKHHGQLTPEQSAKEIFSHVTEGVELARKNNLPDVVVDFIKTHHGTTLVRYFYNQYVAEGGDPLDTEKFRYKGARPVTKEQVILMVCDSVEAASRTLKEHTPEAFSNLVDSIVDGKVAEGQLENADISIRELRIVKDVIKHYLTQINHERISYDNKDKTNK